MRLFEELKKPFYKKGTKEINRDSVVTTIIIITIILVIGVCNHDRQLKLDEERKKNTRYTIGYTEHIYHNFRSSTPNVNYHYKVAGIEYKGSADIYKNNEGKIIPNGGRYFVEFDAKKPENSKLLLDFPIPDTISSPPFTGWYSMPGD